MFVSKLLEETNKEYTEKLLAIAEKCQQSFVNTFLNDYGYLFDYVDGNMIDWSVRPNMIFAAALDYSPLTQEQKKGIIEICTKELLTPKGLRTLSTKSGGTTQCIQVLKHREITPSSRNCMAMAWWFLYGSVSKTI